MKTINNIIENSALGLMTKSYRYGVLFLLSGIIASAMSLFIFVLGNMDYVGYLF